MITLPDGIKRALRLASTEARTAAAAGAVATAGGASAVISAPAATAALAVRTLVEIRVLRETGRGFEFERIWNDVGSITTSVQTAEDDVLETLTFHGAGALMQVGGIPRRTGVQVSTLDIELNHLSEEVLTILQRRTRIRGGRVRVWRAWLEPGTRTVIDHGIRAWTGTINGFKVTTPAEGGAGSLLLSTTSLLTRQFARAGLELRSDASQRLRDPADAFFKDVATAPFLSSNWAGERAQRRPGVVGPGPDPTDR